MEIKEGILAGIKELILPEIAKLKEGQARADVSLAAINQRLDDVNRRLDDVNQHLADQSRRIDETNKRIDAAREELGARIDTTNKRIDTTNERIDSTDASLGRLYEVIVRREEHERLVLRLERLETEFQEFRKRLAA